MVHKLEALLLSALFLAPASAILAKCAQAPTLFALHPAANTLAFLVCFPAGILAMLERKGSADHAYRVKLTKAHFVFQTLALLLMAVGGVAAFLTKEAYGKPHLSSRHSWVAAAAGTLSLLNALGGLATTFGGKKTSWQWKNPGHRIGGIIAFMLGGTAAVLGIFSGSWGKEQLGPDLQRQVAMCAAFAYVWLMQRSLLTKPTAAKPKSN